MANTTRVRNGTALNAIASGSNGRAGPSAWPHVQSDPPGAEGTHDTSNPTTINAMPTTRSRCTRLSPARDSTGAGGGAHVSGEPASDGLRVCSVHRYPSHSR